LNKFGNHVKGIVSNYAGDNLTKFKALKAQGFSNEAAAMGTKTGQHMVKMGFRPVHTTNYGHVRWRKQ
ncbi:hypothetical protein, partial [Armatimonas sp.]|uniref:hypothetical protein n=1 Tax=Armatimonas sp. TaxID=1872638 RepID=UPI0037522F2A